MGIYQRTHDEPPASIVNEGKFCFGTYDGPIRELNMLDASMPLQFPVPRAVKNFRLKEWEAFQIGNGDYFILGAVYNAKIMGIVQLVVIDIAQKKKFIFEKMLPPWKLFVGNSLSNNVTCSCGNGYSFHIHNHLDKGSVRLTIKTKGQKNQPDMDCNFIASHTNEDTAPIVICHPFGPNRALYSHKALMPLEGELYMDGREIRFEKEKSFMIIDDHKGYYPFEMKYDWVTTAGFDVNGRLVGFNLTDNQVKNHEKYNENCLWTGNRVHLLPPIKVKRPEGSMGTWLINDEYGMVDLKFEPQIESKVDINALILKSRYRAPYGVFSGHIKDGNGDKVFFDGFFGMGEDKFIRT